MKLPSLFLILSILALSLVSCQHRNKKSAHCTKNPIAYPIEHDSGAVSAGYGYVK